MYYKVEYHCPNCGHDFKHEFRKGDTAPKIIRCVSCECRTAEKVQMDWNKPAWLSWFEESAPYE